jgi:hypothetical protein
VNTPCILSYVIKSVAACSGRLSLAENSLLPDIFRVAKSSQAEQKGADFGLCAPPKSISCTMSLLYCLKFVYRESLSISAPAESTTPEQTLAPRQLQFTLLRPTMFLSHQQRIVARPTSQSEIVLQYLGVPAKGFP